MEALLLGRLLRDAALPTVDVALSEARACSRSLVSELDALRLPRTEAVSLFMFLVEVFVWCVVSFKGLVDCSALVRSLTCLPGLGTDSDIVLSVTCVVFEE